ncbi:MAG: heme exporter protein CcmD [Roseicyclus sp.]|uniref:heme exporter protein CcmD n=1 Tax=Roseicyclus sp. TaxID=1914329 RepID=UPI003A8BB36C
MIMPDLGSYALPVLSSYAVSLGLLVALIVASVWKARRVRARLEGVENRRGRSA